MHRREKLLLLEQNPTKWGPIISIDYAQICDDNPHMLALYQKVSSHIHISALSKNAQDIGIGRWLMFYVCCARCISNWLSYFIVFKRKHMHVVDFGET